MKFGAYAKSQAALEFLFHENTKHTILRDCITASFIEKFIYNKFD